MNIAALFCWLGIYCLTGYAVGGWFDWPVMGAVIAGAVGFYPALMLGSGAHYEALPLSGIVLIIILVSVPDEMRGWLGLAFCVLPMVWLGFGMVMETLKRKDQSGEENKEEKG